MSIFDFLKALNHSTPLRINAPAKSTHISFQQASLMNITDAFFYKKYLTPI
jgi:hypothetical protein